jgi:phosphoglycolate phosphatase-like HAD superfamily hydrolase
VADRPLLLLWDIDGTLLQRATAEHARALREAAGRAHGVDRLDGQIEYAGRTDAAILRDLLRLAGVSDAAIDERAASVLSASVEAFERICPADLSAFVAPGVPDVLAALAARPEHYRQALLTGNFEPIGRLKVACAGLGGYFEPGQGAFGSDSHSRAQLPAIARRRAGEWPRERTVVIGDTPRDIACARADKVRVVAVATGSFGIDALADADAVVDDARAVLPVLEDWAATPTA